MDAVEAIRLHGLQTLLLWCSSLEVVAAEGLRLFDPILATSQAPGPAVVVGSPYGVGRIRSLSQSALAVHEDS